VTAEKFRLCALTELTTTPAKGFSVKAGTNHQHIFIIQRDGRLYGYLNRCPHTGVNLDWLPNQFLDASGALIVCATHGAQFRVEDGYCIFGPCAGLSLTPAALVIEDGDVYLQSL